MALDPQRLDAAAAGDPEAMIELILAEGQGLRLFIAAHINEVTLVPALELATWSTVRRQLPLRDTGVPVAEWLRWVAAERIDRHLQGINLLGTDEVTRLVVQQCLASLTARHDQQAAEAAAKLQVASAETRDLLKQRYGDGEDLDRIAARRATTVDAIAAALASARSTCDWRGGEAPMGDRLLPRLLEDWLGGVLDPDSRALLMEGVARSPVQAAALIRQVRLHAVLTVLHQPFGLREATALSRAAAKTGETRDQASSYRGRGVSRTTGSDARRPQHASSNPRTAAASSASPSSAPLILIGVVVIIGVLVLLVMTRDGGRPATVAQRDEAPTAPAPVVSTPAAAVTSPAPAPATPTGGSVLRPGFGGSSTPTTGSGPLVVAWSGAAQQSLAYAGEPLRLEVTVSRPDQVAAVEFRLGDRLVATMTRAPYAWEWRDPQPATGELSARALGKDGATLVNLTAPLRIMPAQATGKILREWWRNIDGRTIAEGLKVGGYPDRPFGVAFEKQFSARRDWSDNYIQRMRGYVVPPVDGAYTFWIAGDDEAELRLSNDGTAGNLRLIARCQATSGAAVSYGKWEDRPGQRSEPVMLEKGRRYYVEVLHKEKGGSDHVAVGWQLPDGTMERPIPGNRLMPPDDPTTPSAVGARVFFVDFEGLSAGDKSSALNASLDPEVPTATVVVADGDAADGRRYLAMRDAPGQKGAWLPEVYRMADYSSGVLRVSAALRVRAGGAVAFACRHINADKTVIDGMMFTLDGNGVLAVKDRELMRVPPGTWVRFTATVGLGSRADGTWALTVSPASGPPQEFTRLPSGQGFSRLHQMVFSNIGQTEVVNDLDTVTMHLE